MTRPGQRAMCVPDEAVMGTPKRKRPETVRVMVTAAEKLSLREAAAKTATPLSIWVRAVALEKAQHVNAPS
jgi:hypothetical protein